MISVARTWEDLGIRLIDFANPFAVNNTYCPKHPKQSKERTTSQAQDKRKKSTSTPQCAPDDHGRIIPSGFGTFVEDPVELGAGISDGRLSHCMVSKVR
jgi:hypothetical protein